MKKIPQELIDKLREPIPKWAISENKYKKVGGGQSMTVIHPMAVAERLDDVFGVGQWNTFVEKVGYEKTNDGYDAAGKCILTIPEYDIHLEQFGGSSNKDLGDAFKGSATDALTKCASYLGIGASIYKGQGNGSELNTKDWARVRDNYVMNNQIKPDDYEALGYFQRAVINEVKKAFNNNKEEK